MSTRVKRTTQWLRRHGKRASQTIAKPRRDERNVVFLSGVQRSGTNMVMEMLDLSWQTDVFHEYDPRAFDDYMMRDRETIAALIAASGAPAVIVKALHEADQLRDLMAQFAPARGVWVWRHYNDMVNSNLVNWPGGRNQLEDVVGDRKSAKWRARGMSDQTHAMLRRLYRPDLSDASAIALFWVYRNQLLFDQALEATPQVLLVNYETLVRWPDSQVRRLAAFLGIEANAPMIAAPSTSSLSRRPPPSLDREVEAVCEDMLRRLRRAQAAQDADFAADGRPAKSAATAPAQAREGRPARGAGMRSP